MVPFQEMYLTEVYILALLLCLLGAFRKSAQFINRTAHFINSQIAQQFINCVITFWLRVVACTMSERHEELFEEFCLKHYSNSSSSKYSKTISKNKAEKIKDVIKGENLQNYSSCFKFWVCKTKQFKLLSYPELDLKDVLCLPAKEKVYINI